MFTGLIADLGRVVDAEAGAGGSRLTIESTLATELADGDSVSVNGACLTARRVRPGRFGADVVPETLRRSSLGSLVPGAAVNLELALRAADRLGGHLVQGHVDGLGSVVEVRHEGLATNISVEAEPALLRYVVEKGSIAVEGVSLTVSAVGEARFSVSLIPETLERTNLGSVVEGAAVNLEVDILAKYVEKLARQTADVHV